MDIKEISGIENKAPLKRENVEKEGLVYVSIKQVRPGPDPTETLATAKDTNVMINNINNINNIRDVQKSQKNVRDVQHVHEQLADILEEKLYKKQLDQEWSPDIHRIGVFYSNDVYPKRAFERLQYLCRLFSLEKLKSYFVPLIARHHGIAWHSIDWLVTNFSKKRKILVQHKITKEFINIHVNYKNWLRYYQRELFDAFCRGQRTFFEFQGKRYETTVAQINFLHWSHCTGILDFAQQNIKMIEDDMDRTKEMRQHEKKQAALVGQKKKRRELSKSTSSNCTVYGLDLTTLIV